LSNPSARDKVDLVDALMARAPAPQSACHQAIHDARHPHIRDTVDVDELARRHLSGQTIKELAGTYSISESSVKRLLRSEDARAVVKDLF
jgi:hypothetical protein